MFLDVDICLDLLDTKREQSDISIALYMHYKDNQKIEFITSGDFITTIYYILTEKRKIDPTKVVRTIDALTTEVSPVYLKQDDFIIAKRKFYENTLYDLEDLMILQSALRTGCNIFLTQNTRLLELKEYENIKILSVTSFIASINTK